MQQSHGVFAIAKLLVHTDIKVCVTFAERNKPSGLCKRYVTMALITGLSKTASKMLVTARLVHFISGVFERKN